jgi:hypothetical protein
MMTASLGCFSRTVAAWKSSTSDTPAALRKGQIEVLEREYWFDERTVQQSQKP